jgi:hypothetical protein
LVRILGGSLLRFGFGPAVHSPSLSRSRVGSALIYANSESGLDFWEFSSSGVRRFGSLVYRLLAILGWRRCKAGFWRLVVGCVVSWVCVCIMLAMFGVVPSAVEWSCSLFGVVPAVFGLSFYMIDTPPRVYSRKRKSSNSASMPFSASDFTMEPKGCVL